MSFENHPSDECCVSGARAQPQHGKTFPCSPQHQADAVTKKFDPETDRFWSAGFLNPRKERQKNVY